MLINFKKTFFLSILMLICINVFAADIETIHPYRGSIQKSFTEPAKTYLENTYTINMPIYSKLERLSVREGSKVTQGQIVAQLDQIPLIQTVNLTKAQLRNYQAQYKLQQKIVYRQTRLREKGFASQQTLDDAVTQKEVFAAQIKQSIAGLAIAVYALKESVMYAPINGTVLKRYTEGGKWFASGSPILEIGDLSQLKAICDVLTQEAQQVQIGDTVLLTSIGSPITLHGTVSRIYPAGFTKKSSLGVDEQRVNIIINLKNPQAANLGLDYRVQAQFLVGSKEKNALIVPRFSVLQDDQNNYYVIMVKNKKLHKKIVKVNIITDDKISITNGLSTNDNIVAQPTADMKDGMKI
ncbi:MAG: efflux RND transporter periplasmic adaptor subunit [Gammaproteobacteria bacterium]|jgi:HlyD family secretion protein